MFRGEKIFVEIRIDTNFGESRFLKGESWDGQREFKQGRRILLGIAPGAQPKTPRRWGSSRQSFSAGLKPRPSGATGLGAGAVMSESCPGIAPQPRAANSTGTHKPRTGIPVRGPNREFVEGESRSGQNEFKNPPFPEKGKDGAH
jgi:hypothetical protein